MVWECLRSTGHLFNMFARCNYDFRVSIINHPSWIQNRILVEHQQGFMSFYFDEKENQFVEESSTYQFKDFFQVVVMFGRRSDGFIWVQSRIRWRWLN